MRWTSSHSRRSEQIPEAVADDQHPDHQLGDPIEDADIAIVETQMRSNLGQVDEPVDLAQQMTIGDVPLKG